MMKRLNEAGLVRFKFCSVQIINHSQPASCNISKRLVKELKKFNDLESESDLTSFYNSRTRDNLMHRLGIGTMRNIKSVFKGNILPVWTCRAYTRSEEYRICKSKLMFLPRTNLKNQTLTIDFPGAYPELVFIIYFMSGICDLRVNVNLSKDYFDHLVAQLKRFCIFKNSAHGPLFEDPERFRAILEKDILQPVNRLKD